MSTLPLKHQHDYYHPSNSSQIYSKVDFTKPLVNISYNCCFDSIFKTWTREVW